MFRQFETILTAGCIVLSAVFLTALAIRIRNACDTKRTRINTWGKEAGIINQVGKTIIAVSLLLLIPGVIYFIFIVVPPAAVIRGYARIMFIMSFSAWALVEIGLCNSVSEKLLKGSRLRRTAFYAAAIACAVLAAFLFPLIPKSLPYPAESECVMLDLPVRGTWLAGLAGASKITNGHLTNKYAIDILKIGPDGRLFKGKEKAVTDFYSYNEPIYAPADGRVTQIVDSLESDRMGNMDEAHPGGNYIIFDLGNQKYVFFGHLKKGSIAVTEGQSVNANALLGLVGNSGYSTHPHIHMHVQNKPTANPDGRMTYPFRFYKMKRLRLMFWKEVRNGALLRNDLFSK